MAQPSIDTAFVEEFEQGVHLAYQRMGSKLRNTLRTRDGVQNKTTFQKMGKGSATQKDRHGQVSPMNLSHDTVSVVVEDWFAGEWVDELDTLRINHDEMLVAQESGAAALGRKTDEQITTALNTTTTTQDSTSANIDLAFALQLMETFGNNEVPDDGQRHAVVAWQHWSQLMNITEFTRADFVGQDQLPFPAGMTAKRWLGFMWFPHSGLPIPSAGQHTAFAYHRDAAAHVIGNDVESNMQYHNDRDSTFVLNKMQMNAVLIDEDGVVSMDIQD